MAAAIGAALKRWARGLSHDAEPVSDAPADPELEPSPEEEPLDDEEEDEPLESGERNLIWAGEDPRDDFSELDEAEAEALADWMADHEPDVWAAVLGLADAVAEGDDAQADIQAQMLAEAEQYLAPEYPELDASQREAIAEGVRIHTPEAGPVIGSILAVAECRAMIGGDPGDEELEEEEPEEDPDSLDAPGAPSIAA